MPSRGRRDQWLPSVQGRCVASGKGSVTDIWMSGCYCIQVSVLAVILDSSLGRCCPWRKLGQGHTRSLLLFPICACKSLIISKSEKDNFPIYFCMRLNFPRMFQPKYHMANDWLQELKWGSSWLLLSQVLKKLQKCKAMPLCSVCILLFLKYTCFSSKIRFYGDT